MSKKTRKNSGSLIGDFLGEPGKDWLHSELPTLRDVLLYMQFIKELIELDAQNLPVKDLTKEIFSFMFQIQILHRRKPLQTEKK